MQRNRICSLIVLAAALAASVPAQAQQKANGPVIVTDVEGVIGVSATRQISQAIQYAVAQQATALIIRLDTPGGLVTSTRDIIKTMIGASVPVIVYVAPSGARAASAGTYITYAAHVAAMAPGTNLGAATPIELGGLPGLPQRPPEQPAN